MELRIRGNFRWVVLHVFGCVIALLILGYAVFVWAGYGFTLGPDQRLHPGAPDPSAGARYFFLGGLTVSAYCAFALYLTTGSSQKSDSDATDDSPPSM
jgi:hypothetical protein